MNLLIIITNPVGIVDHGDYITDTVNGLDYLDFSFTTGLSFDTAITTFSPAGWQAATGAQVQSLEALFGWVADTPSIFGAGPTANAGLTDAIAGYLGYTFFNTTATTCCGNRGILATLADVRSAGTNWDAFLQIDVITNNLNDQVDINYESGPTGTGVTSNSFAFQATWLVRAASVPEPTTTALIALGLLGAGFARKRRTQ